MKMEILLLNQLAIYRSYQMFLKKYLKLLFTASVPTFSIHTFNHPIKMKKKTTASAKPKKTVKKKAEPVKKPARNSNRKKKILGMQDFSVYLDKWKKAATAENAQRFKYQNGIYAVKISMDEIIRITPLHVIYSTVVVTAEQRINHSDRKELTKQEYKIFKDIADAWEQFTQA